MSEISSASASDPNASSSHDPEPKSMETTNEGKSDVWVESSNLLPGHKTLMRRYYLHGVSFIERLTCNTWILEISSLIVSLVCSSAIAVVLCIYDGRPAPSLPQGITLNATISILATVSKACLIFTVASCISQLKWNWYQRPRNLKDLQFFDDASRGPLGSAQLLVKLASVQMPFLASLGALLICLSTLFDPFIQQCLIYPVRDVFVNSSTTWTAQSQLFNSTSIVDEGFMQYLYAGIYADDLSEFERNPTCPSGNCTWSTFPSLGWCSVCSGGLPSARIDCNTTRFEEIENGHTESTNKTCHVSFDQGLNTSFPIYGADYNPSEYMTMAPNTIVSLLYSYATTSTTKNQPILQAVQKTWPELLNPLAVFSQVTLDGPLNMDTSFRLADAQICALDLCIQDLNISVLNGVSHIHMLGQRFGHKLLVKPEDKQSPVAQYDCYALSNHSIQWSDHPENMYDEITLLDRQNFAWCDLEPNEWVQWIADALVGNRSYFDILCKDPNKTVNTGCGVTEPNTEPFTYSSDDASDVINYTLENGLPKVMTGLAAALTKFALIRDENKIYGQSSRPVVFVHVRWFWLILPFLSNTAGIVVLACTIATGRSHPVPLWKSSIYALLSCGLESPIVTVKDYGETQSELQKAAGFIHVKLKRSEKDGSLTLGT